MDYYNKFYELRKKLNLSQEQLAEKVGVARQTISKWELGETSPNLQQAQVLSQIFHVSVDELLGNDVRESIKNDEKRKENNNVHWKRIITIGIATVCLCFVILGVVGVVNGLQILHPQGIERTVYINRKGPIAIGIGDSETIVFSEDGKPRIVCEIPEEFVADANISGLYTDSYGNFIKFNADYSNDITNPLLGTDYYSYYEKRGYSSYMDMSNMAMCFDLSKTGIFSSKEEKYLAGGAKIIRDQLCAGQNADYYAIDGGLTASGDEMRIYGFALHFENTAWLITLKDYNDNYYFISIKDPEGIGKTIDSIGEILSSISITE